MTGILRRLQALSHRFEEAAIAGLLGVMTLVTFTQVVLRYVFNTGLGWALELTTFLFAWLVLFGMSYGVRIGAHIAVTALVERLPAGIRKLVGLSAAALSLVYCALFFIGGWDYVRRMYLIGIDAQDIPVPVWIPLSILPLGFALLAFRIAGAALDIWEGRRQALTDIGGEAPRAGEGNGP